MATGRVGVGWSFRGPGPETRTVNPPRTRNPIRVEMLPRPRNPWVPETRRGPRNPALDGDGRGREERADGISEPIAVGEAGRALPSSTGSGLELGRSSSLRPGKWPAAPLDPLQKQRQRGRGARDLGRRSQAWDLGRRSRARELQLGDGGVVQARRRRELKLAAGRGPSGQRQSPRTLLPLRRPPRSFPHPLPLQANPWRSGAGEVNWIHVAVRAAGAAPALPGLAVDGENPST
jgi:hypothetical protein